MNRAPKALVVIASLCLLATLAFAQQTTGASASAQANQAGNAPAQDKAPQSSIVPEISADRGSCTVEFKVTNFTGQPIYGAKIHTQVKWGLFHKLDMDVATNADGRARFIKMPNTVKNPLVFELRSAADEALMTWDPGTNCQAEYTVPLHHKNK